MSERFRKLDRAVAAFAAARRWDKFHNPKNLAMAMSVEAAEVVEIFQWLTPRRAARLTAPEREHLGEELADTLIYLIRLAQKTGVDLLDAAEDKMVKNARKYPAGSARRALVRPRRR